MLATSADHTAHVAAPRVAEVGARRAGATTVGIGFGLFRPPFSRVPFTPRRLIDFLRSETLFSRTAHSAPVPRMPRRDLIAHRAIVILVRITDKRIDQKPGDCGYRHGRQRIRGPFNRSAHPSPLDVIVPARL